ncbi:MAG TPA: XRE family transcriptional regulator [Vicinamibacteria bacterium]|nr:XRE family transcriptional regulator [Vicinamibacteria bacterium]
MTAFGETAGLVGLRLRELRANSGLSLDAASQRVGVSRRLLVALEQGDGNPSLSTLLRLADGYGVGLAALVGRSETASINVCSESEAKRLWTSRRGSEARLLIASHDLELWSWKLAPGDVRQSEPHRPGAQEIVRLTRGRLAVSVEGEREELCAGKLALFAGDRSHRYENPGDSPALFTLVVHDPLR